MRVRAEQAQAERSQSAHVVVLGNEKGGSGKSTTAMHVAVALMKAGQRRGTRGETLKIEENETVEFAGFADAITSVEHTHDFVVIDTPGADTYLTRLAHSMADTLITPLNDSFIDFDALGKVD